MTSWTTSLDEAVRRATDHGSTHGVVLTVRAASVADQVRVSPNYNAKEGEVCLEGRVSGAKVSRVGD